MRTQGTPHCPRRTGVCTPRSGEDTGALTTCESHSKPPKGYYYVEKFVQNVNKCWNFPETWQPFDTSLHGSSSWPFSKAAPASTLSTLAAPNLLHHPVCLPGPPPKWLSTRYSLLSLVYWHRKLTINWRKSLSTIHCFFLYHVKMTFKKNLLIIFKKLWS
jgi:hypothetical protein